jgi:hypothetical protein
MSNDDNLYGSSDNFPLDQSEFDSFLVEVCELYRQHGSKLNIAAILEHIKASVEYSILFERGTSNPDNFISMDDIERLIVNLGNKRHDIDFNNLLNDMVQLSAEKKIIAKKKLSTPKKA